MMTDEMRSQCEMMSDENLVRALTVDKTQYSEVFHNVVKHEMFRRGISLLDYVNNIRIRHNNEPEIEIKWSEIKGEIPSQLSLWETWFFNNVLGQLLYFQKEVMWTSVHFIAADEAPESYFIESEMIMKEIVNRFVNLEDWREGLKNEVQLETWRIISESDSIDYVKLISGKLADKEIVSTVKSQGYRNCACGGGTLKLLVPEEVENEAKEVLAQLKIETNQLYDEAESFTEGSDLQREMEVYQRLSVLLPDDAHVHFNLGIVLFERNKLEEAAQAFTVSALVDPMNMEMLESNLEYLIAISEKLPDQPEILHTMAGLLIQKGEAISEITPIYQKILNQNEMDPMAHLNLGYLYYQSEGSMDDANVHFKRYLELFPDAEDKAQIEEIINQNQEI